MKHEMTPWKCFVPDTPSFCDHIWSSVELFSETEDDTGPFESPLLPRTLLYLVMANFSASRSLTAKKRGKSLLYY